MAFVDQTCQFRKRRGATETKHCWHRCGISKDHPNYNPEIRVMHSVCCWCGMEMEKPHGQFLPAMPDP